MQTVDDFKELLHCVNVPRRKLFWGGLDLRIRQTVVVTPAGNPPHDPVVKTCRATEKFDAHGEPIQMVYWDRFDPPTAENLDDGSAYLAQTRGGRPGLEAMKERRQDVFKGWEPAIPRQQFEATK